MWRYVSTVARRSPLLTVFAIYFLCDVAAAQTLPAPWEATNIGNPVSSGYATYGLTSDTFTIDGVGAQISSTTDQFYFLFQEIAGDAELFARIDTILAASSAARVGVMMRAS